MTSGAHQRITVFLWAATVRQFLSQWLGRERSVSLSGSMNDRRLYQAYLLVRYLLLRYLLVRYLLVQL